MLELGHLRLVLKAIAPDHVLVLIIGLVYTARLTAGARGWGGTCFHGQLVVF